MPECRPQHIGSTVDPTSTVILVQTFEEDPHEYPAADYWVAILISFTTNHDSVLRGAEPH